jgi:diguanylate cyclase (GGDEF)-like protein
LTPLASLQRLNQALLPDYNRRAALFWWLTVCAGSVGIAWSFWTLVHQPADHVGQVVAGILLAVAAAFFPIMLPRTKSAFSAGEVFIFMLLLLHGPHAAVLAAAADAAVASSRVSKRWSSRIVSPAMCALSIGVAGGMLHMVLAHLESLGLRSSGVVVIATLWTAIVQFLINSVLVSSQLRLKRGERPTWSDVAGNFGVTVAVNAASACAAAMMAVSFHATGLATILVVGPPLALLLAILHAFFKQQEANRTIAEATAQAARREAEITVQHLQEMHHIAFHDALTGLPNRRRFVEELAKVVQQALQDPSQGFAVMFLDFDRFKFINDSLGHAAGDEFLTLVAKRIASRVRPEDLVARLGGDEFALLLRRAQPDQGVVELATRIQEVVSQPYRVAGTEITSSASIGITISTRGYDKPGDVLRDADIAMYRAKAAGKARHVLFDGEMHAEIARRMRLEGDLRRTIAEGSLEVAYQPILDLRDEFRLLGFEALARWHHPELGTIEPSEFIAIAEESSLVVQITDLVLARACADLRRWHGRGANWSALRLHVNISDKDVAQRNLPQRIQGALFEAALRPEHLVLELTEVILMRRLATERQVLEDLRQFGIGLSIDDFGMGYSSLAHLSSLPIDSLKIDRSFIDGLLTRPTDAAIVRTILDLGRSLGRQVVAEGIENAGQLSALRGLGCAFGQGHFLSSPLSAQAVDALIDRLDVASAPTLVEGLANPARLFH